MDQDARRVGPTNSRSREMFQDVSNDEEEEEEEEEEEDRALFASHVCSSEIRHSRGSFPLRC